MLTSYIKVLPNYTRNQGSHRLQMENNMNTKIKALDIKMDLRTLNHELRTPLTAIIGIIHLFTSDTLSEEQKTEYLQYLTDSSDRLKRFIEKLLESPLKNVNLDKYNFLTFKTQEIHDEVVLLLTDNATKDANKADMQHAALP